MFVLAYRNDNGSLRVGTPILNARVAANAYARRFATRYNRTVTILDLTEVLDNLSEQQPEEDFFNEGPKWHNDNWREDGWYCGHSFNFCYYCFAV